MKFRILLLPLVLFTKAAFLPVSAQESNCKNLGFERGNFINWKGYQWIYSVAQPSRSTPVTETLLPTYRRHVIITDQTAYDANTGNKLKKIPPGYRYSARLGDEINSQDPGNFRCWEQSLRYTMDIDSTNALLVMKFALVLQYATDHTTTMEPRFRVQLYDEKGDTIPDCANYDVYASNENIRGFNTYTPSGGTSTVKWRDWTTVGVNLLNYVGQSITIEFMSADCTKNFHYGYAYFVAACHPLYITVKYCAGDSVASLTAPEGFDQYKWRDGGGSVVDTTQILTLSNPPEGAAYSCDMTSETGCTVTLNSKIERYVLNIDFGSYMIDCKSNKVQFTNQSSTTHGYLSYIWHFDDGKTSTEKEPLYTFATSGLHQVSLEVMNPPSSCGDSLVKTIESFSPPLVGVTGDSTYCPGHTTTLKAYGAFDYTWSNGSKAESLEIGAPGGTVWLLGRSSTGCVSDTIFRPVTEEPDWKFANEGDSVLCQGRNAVLTASDAVHYLWNTGDTTKAILVEAPGTYSVTGTNRRGCDKTAVINLQEYPPPVAGFSLSVQTLDRRHNQLTGNAELQPAWVYSWEMGDGSVETGARVTHTYQIPDTVYDYRIRLTVTNEYGCTDTLSGSVEVTPFIPNVFSPNGDGVNDIFVPGLEAEVFDRHGLVFYRGNEGWDGNYKGRPADPDTYFYVVHYMTGDLELRTRKGYITLVR